MRVSTLNMLSSGDVELGVVYASVEGVNEKSYDECIEQLTHKAQALGATALVALQLVHSQFPWNHRTSLLSTAVKAAWKKQAGRVGAGPSAPLPVHGVRGRQGQARRDGRHLAGGGRLSICISTLW